MSQLQEEKEKDTKGEQEVPASSQEDKTSTSSQVQESSLQDQTAPTSDKTEQNAKERIQTLEMEKKELELQLESYLTADKEQREKAELITAEKKARQHVRAEFSVSQYKLHECQDIEVQYLSKDLPLETNPLPGWL